MISITQSLKGWSVLCFIDARWSAVCARWQVVQPLQRLSRFVLPLTCYTLPLFSGLVQRDGSGVIENRRVWGEHDSWWKNKKEWKARAVAAQSDGISEEMGQVLPSNFKAPRIWWEILSCHRWRALIPGVQTCCYRSDTRRAWWIFLMHQWRSAAIKPPYIRNINYMFTGDLWLFLL